MKGLACMLLVGVCAGGALCVTVGNTTLDENAWWGPEDGKCTHDTSIRSFTPEFSNEMIADLIGRLKNHRPFVAPLENTGFSYGFNSDQMPKWIKYWTEEYPFAERVKYINKYPHFKTCIQGLDIHYIHIVPEVPDGVKIVPLMLLHGFSTSFLEFYEAIPYLTAVSDDRDYAVEIIIPSLPGYAYSDATSLPGMGCEELGIVMRNLMKRLGHDQYYLQAGDWGAYVAATIATIFPEEVLGYHSNFLNSFHPQSLMTWYLGSVNPDLVVDPSVADRMYPISKILKFLVQEFGYFHIQSAKPDTIGIVLTDSPSGLLAYIFQLMAMANRADSTYSEDGGLENQFTKEHLIDNLMIYWSTNTITTACRLYAETANLKGYASGIGIVTPTPVLTWTIHAKDELLYQSPYLLKFKYPNLVNSTILDTGGHYLAKELPEIFSVDVLNAITAFERIHEGNECT